MYQEKTLDNQPGQRRLTRKQTGIIGLHAFIGWALCTAAMVIPAAIDYYNTLSADPLLALRPEQIEALLLGLEILLRWVCYRLLECPVHTFMAAVLLRLSRVDSFRQNAERNPPDRQA